MRLVRFAFPLIGLLGFLLAGESIATAAPGEVPTVHDPRLQLTLFAEDPEIVTPVGMAIDGQDRIFVVESHTHLRPRDYDGPKTDRIRVFVDRDGDGRSDDVREFAEGLTAAMNLAFSPEGTLYAVCAHEVVALHDDADGVCDRRERVLELITPERYPHSCLLSMTFSQDGWLYVGRGNTGSKKHTLRGTDGSEVSGYGDGGDIVRCRPDGTDLELFATGFWNPFDIKFDDAGRLLCVDNDPDARGPNRLVHVVAGGDYGYRSLYGGSGNHPYQGWDGDLPGTLPYISGTGEAPSGLIDADHVALPAEYRDSVLVTVWNENTIERHALRPRGVSLRGERSVLVSGGKDFRPVALAADSRGNLYVTDWVLVDYPNHGRGRIWRLSVREDVQVNAPRPASDVASRDAGSTEIDRVLRSRAADDLPRLVEALQSGDAFLHHAATIALSAPEFASKLPGLADHTDPGVRLGALLAARRSSVPEPETLAGRFLRDADPGVRRAALIWVGEAGMTPLRPQIDEAIRTGDVPGLLFETYLATIPMLEPRFIGAWRDRVAESSRSLLKPVDDRELIGIARDERHPAAIRARAVDHLDDAEKHADWLISLVHSAERPLQFAAISRLRDANRSEVTAALLDTAQSPDHSPDLRAEALLSLSYHDPVPTDTILRLLGESEGIIRMEAARTLRRAQLSAKQREVVRKLWREMGESSERSLREQFDIILGEATPDRPDSIEQWKRTLASGGDPAAGRRVFFSSNLACSRCHAIDGTGGALGPSLSNVGQSLRPEQIADAILRPSQKFPPQYQAWAVITTDGRVHTGLQLDHKAGGAIELLTIEGVTRRFEADEIDDYRALPKSLMPDDLQSSMTVSEFRDLVAYLESLR